MTPRRVFLLAECPSLLELRPFGQLLDLTRLVGLAAQEETDRLRRGVEVVRFVALMRSSDLASGLVRLPAGVSMQIVPEACSHRGCLEVGWELARALEDSDEGDGLLLASALPESVHLIHTARDDGLHVTLVAPCIDALTPAILAADRFIDAQALHRPP